MNKQKLAILGSTGSIGTQVLEVVRQHKDAFEIVALTANGNWELLAEQIKEFAPKFALICNDTHYSNLFLAEGRGCCRRLSASGREARAGSGGAEHSIAPPILR